jgi:hypothetical protein
VFLSLTLLNAVFYGIICFGRGNQFALHLFVLSLAGLVGGFPEDWGRRLFSGFNRAECLWGAAAACLLFWTVRVRNPAAGVFGGLVAGLVIGIGLGDQTNAVHWAIQAGLVTLLIQSLRWEDRYHSGAGWLRGLTCAVWVCHAFVWMHTSGAFWMASCATAPLIIAYGSGRLITGKWGPRIVPFAVALVLLSAPADTGTVRLRTLSTGVLAVVGSFVLFALGTLAALIRHRWHGKAAEE